MVAVRVVWSWVLLVENGWRKWGFRGLKMEISEADFLVVEVSLADYFG